MPAPAPSPAPSPAPAPAPSPPSPRTPQQPRQPAPAGSSFFFDDADIFEVAQTVFGEVLKVNYIIDPAVKGRVNFRTTTPIPRDKILPVMEIIFRLNGVAIVEESGLYRIIPIGGIAKEPAPVRFGKDPESVELRGTALVQVVPIEFMNSAEMARILTPLLTQGGAVLDVPKKNFLIIADTDANVRRLLQLVNMFDENAAQDITQPKIYVYPLQNSKADHISKILQQVLLGTSGAAAAPRRTETTPAATPAGQRQPVTPPSPTAQPAGAGEPLVAPGTKIIPDEVTNSLVIFASPGDYALIQAAIKQLDTIPRQVMIEAVVASVTLTDNLSFGMRWNLDTDINITNIGSLKNDVNIGGTLGFQGLARPDSGFSYFAVDSRGNVRLLIEALAGESKAKILSNPHVLVADNREARIQVGRQIPIATSTTTTPLGTGTGSTNTTTATIQYKDTGTILKVKPQINDSGLISLELSQEVSNFENASVLGTTQFVIIKNEVTTNLVAQNGQTIVIGGLIDESGRKTKSGVPFLSKIPIIGYLFGTTSDDVTRQELIVLLTPRVVRNQDEAEQMSSDYRELLRNVTRELQLERRFQQSRPPQK
ncbi:MAG: secretin N-terminal domain-containing protein [Nitrospirota bacterium]